MIRNARSIKLVNDIDLAHRDSDAMMIMANGRTFTVTDSAPKKLIMNTLAKAAIERDRALDEPSAEDERLLTMSPNTATLARQKKARQQQTCSPQAKPKVTFHQDPGNSAVQSSTPR